MVETAFIVAHYQIADTITMVDTGEILETLCRGNRESLDGIESVGLVEIVDVIKMVKIVLDENGKYGKSSFQIRIRA